MSQNNRWEAAEQRSPEKEGEGVRGRLWHLWLNTLGLENCLEEEIFPPELPSQPTSRDKQNLTVLSLGGHGVLQKTRAAAGETGSRLSHQHYQSGIHARAISPSPVSNRSSGGSGPAGWAATNSIFLACLFLQRGFSWLCIGLSTSAQLRKMLVPPHPNSQANHCLKCLLITGNEEADGFTGNHTGVRGWELCPSAPLIVREIQCVKFLNSTSHRGRCKPWHKSETPSFTILRRLKGWCNPWKSWILCARFNPSMSTAILGNHWQKQS